MNEEAKIVFTPALMISFRRARKFSSYLLMVKLHPIERTLISFKYNERRCQTQF